MEAITKGHPNYARYEEYRNSLEQSVVCKIDTWQEFNDWLQASTIAAQEHNSLLGFTTTLGLLRAVTYVMIESPEEGDVRVILRNIMDCIVYRPDITLCDLVETQTRILDSVMSLLMMGGGKDDDTAATLH